MILQETKKEEFPGVRHVVEALVPRHVSVGLSDPRVPRSAQFPEEAAYLPPMRALRRREFLAGREALRAAFAAQGLGPTAIGVRDDRAPDLPTGTTASLSHSDTLCVALAARSEQSAGLGIDIDTADALDHPLWETVCTRRERAWLAAQPVAARGLWAKHIFCAKEAAYKCQYAVSETLVDFHAVDLTFSPGRRFFATFRQAVGPFQISDRISGRYDYVAEHIVATAHIPA